VSVEASLYLFDGYNVLHAGSFESAAELIDALASFVATRGARGVVVFDGVGQDVQRGPLSVRYSPHADDLLERLAAEHRTRERVLLVTSDAAVAGTAGVAVARLTSQAFVNELGPAGHRDDLPGGLADKLDPATRARLERLRRGE
jgi:predicted RNA-binding protein with PIN domain